jgi:hypothetical protein
VRDQPGGTVPSSRRMYRLRPAPFFLDWEASSSSRIVLVPCHVGWAHVSKGVFGMALLHPRAALL